MNSKNIFDLIYRLLGLASLAWGLYQLINMTIGFLAFWITKSIGQAADMYWDLISLALLFTFLGLAALHFAPKILAWLYREE